MTAKVRGELARLDWTLDEFAARIGWKKASALRNVLSGNNTSERARHRCEQALGVPIWTEPVVFERRRIARVIFAADPHTLGRTALQRLAKKYLRPAGVAYDCRPASRLRDRLEEFAAQTYRPVKEEGQ